MLNVEDTGVSACVFYHWDWRSVFNDCKFTAVTRINKQWSLMDLQEELFRTDRAIQYE